jgi:hypothetical protein
MPITIRATPKSIRPFIYRPSDSAAQFLINFAAAAAAVPHTYTRELS